MAREFMRAPGGGEVWKVGSSYYLAYRVPQVEPAVYMTWSVDGTDELQAIVGPGESTAPDRNLSNEQYRATGALNFGGSDELQNFSEDPFAEMVSNYEVDAAANPFMRDPEVLATMAQAWLEGRTVSQSELSQTDYWQTHSQAERDWMLTRARDPESARDQAADAYRAVEAQLRDAGVADAPPELVRTLADRWVSGQWSESFIANQVQGISDPYADIDLAEPVLNAARGFDPTAGDASAVAGGEVGIRGRIEDVFTNRGLDPNQHLDGTVEEGRLDRLVEEVRSGAKTINDIRETANQTGGMHSVTGRDLTRAGEDEVNALVQDWLGPAIGSQYQGEWARRWAGRMRNDPDAQTELVEELKTLRLAAFPEWDNENLRYVDVAPTTQSLFNQVWKQAPDESDPLFLDALRMTGPGGKGLHAASSLLRREGLKRQIGGVVQEVSEGITGATGGAVRNSTI